MKLSEIKTNPNNPRIIKDDKFQKLKKSIKDRIGLLIVINKNFNCLKARIFFFKEEMNYNLQLNQSAEKHGDILASITI